MSIIAKLMNEWIHWLSSKPKPRWEPAKTSREEVFSAMILFLELLAREQETQVITHNVNKTSILVTFYHFYQHHHLHKPLGAVISLNNLDLWQPLLPPSTASLTWKWKGVWDSSIGGHVWARLEPLEAAQPRLHRLHGRHSAGCFSHQVI